MTTANRLLLQGFEWHTPSNPPAPHETHSSTSHYARLIRLLPSLADLGVTDLWLPPCCKAMNTQGNGYDIYDLWDLGEFDQKGARSTKWGSREELGDLLATGRDCGVEIVWDAVLNHKAGADGTEECWAVEVDREDRRYEICPPKKLEAWLRFNFAGREHDGELKYSSFRWRAEHFNGVDWDQRWQKNAIYKLIDDSSNTEPFEPPKRPGMKWRRSSGGYLRSLLHGPSSSRLKQPPGPPPQRPGKGWAKEVDSENGNNDYLMFSNIDYTHKQVREDVTKWGRWMIEETGIDGFRLDAVQHFSYSFTRDWIQAVQEASIRRRRKDVFIVGEVWTADLQRITNWLDAVQHPSGPQVYAFDSPLVYHFSRISQAVDKGKADFRTLFSGSSLSAQRPKAAVTLVRNHDTQPGQTSYTPISSWLRPFFYAFILLRQEGIPCVFWGDLFGTQGPHAERPISDIQSRPSLLGILMLCRRLFAYGEQTDYSSKSKDSIGWTRAGTDDRPGCAVLCFVGNPKMVRSVEMTIGKPREVWIDVLRNWSKDVVIGEDGRGRFMCCSGDVCVYVRKDAPERKRLRVNLDLGTAR